MASHTPSFRSPSSALGLLPPLCSPLFPGLLRRQRYLGHGGIAAIEVKVLAAVEGNGEGAAEAQRGGGLWEAGVQEGQTSGQREGGLRTS